MGVLDSRRPPLPAPTESMDENDTSGGDTEVATNVTARTDKTHYTIPEDGRPITISTQKLTGGGSKEGRSVGRHGRRKSQTSLLIEYFEASKTGDKSRSRPSVRVKVTPSATKKSRSGNESVQITSIGADRKPSYTRRIPLPSGKADDGGIEGTDISHSSGSNVSGHPPVEIEVLNGSDASRPDRSSRGLMFAPAESNVSSMPPDSMLEGENSLLESEQGHEAEVRAKEGDYLSAPQRTGSRSRSASRDRITQKVMEKLAASPGKPRKTSRSAKDYDHEGASRERRRRSSKSQRSEDDAMSGAESALSSKLNLSERSYRSGTSQASRMTNNPKLLEMVEDTIKRMILPEINAIKQDQKTDRKLRDFDEQRRGSLQEGSTSLERRVSKSSSTPHLTSKPKVVLNREGDDPGVVLSRGDSERVKTRKSSREQDNDRTSSRRSSGRQSREGSYEDDRVRPKSSRSALGLRGAAAAGLGAGALPAAALKHHDSRDDLETRRKRRTKSRSSRSRSASISESVNEANLHKKVPPMPLASDLNSSEVTRESILSQNTERPSSRGSHDFRTSIREVSRGSVGEAISPASSRTPTRPSSRNLGMSHTNLPLQSPVLESPPLDSPASSAKSPNAGTSNKARLAALAAAGLGGAALAKSMQDRHVDADGYGDAAPRRKISSGSPVQSVSSLRKTFEDDPLIPQGLRPRSAASRSSAERLRETRHSQSSLRSESSPITQRLAQSAKQSRDTSEHKNAYLDSPEPSGTPNGETADEWLERQHLINDQYRDSNRDSYQTNPYPEDAKRFTMLTDDSFLDRRTEDGDLGEQDVRDVSGGRLNPNLMNTPTGVESAVASLMDPSTVSSNALSSANSPRKSNGTYSDRMQAQLQPPLYEGSTMSQNMPSQDRWAAIKGHARHLSNSTDQSPRQSPVRDARDIHSIDEQPVLGTSGLPVADDPMPEIGHYDSKSDLTTNPSIIRGPLGGDATGKSTWPYTPEPEQHEAFGQGEYGKKALAAAAAVGAAGGAATLAAAHAARQPRVEDERMELDRDGVNARSPGYPDEGYATDARTRSGGAITPRQEHQVYSKKDIEDYHRAMDAQDLGDEDPFGADSKHLRHFSGDSHGMESPLYDASTGKGLDRIQSKDIVALMDHLTVRDAQRNARDTEILTSLVRSAAEMRSSFDEMKKFIAEQDRLIMQNTDRDAEYTAQKVLSGPRPQPLGSPRTPRRTTQSEEEIQTKRKGVLQRALKGLTKGKSSKDLARIEDMLMQILHNVEDLKHQNDGAPLDRSYTLDSIESYEKMRATQDSGYEPEGQADTSSTPSQSGHFPITPREKQQFHSGYDGRRGSDNRVSTVLEEESDEELAPHEAHVLNHQFENNERLLTPTQELHRKLSPKDTPPQPAAVSNDNTPDKKQKHKSNTSSLFGAIPKISRWSRTTASSAAPDPTVLDNPKQVHKERPSFESSLSRSTLDDYDDDGYSLRDDDRLRSTQSLAKEQARHASNVEAQSMRSQTSSRLTRTPSPLIPSEASAKQGYSYGDQIESPVQEDDDAEYDDPKYHAHRNSLLLEHPQPRQGTTSRHQNTLESRAQNFDDATGTNSDLSQATVSDFDPAVWGSSGTAGLARHRLAHADPLSPMSINKKASGDGPLVPQQQKPPVPPKVKYEEEEEDDIDWEPQYSNSGFSKGGYYDSPYGSGHLLEPIAEVRYSLETDSGKLSPEPQVASAKAVDLRSPGRRNLTGPRPMGSGRSPAAVQQKVAEQAGTVRRKPVPGARGG